jgi:monothiol glutaredoxin
MKVDVMDIAETIKQQISDNTVILFMKGSPQLPQCGFSSQASQALISIGEKFAYVDILANPEIRANLPKISNWPTFPQLFVNGELVGGCDIMMELFQSGQLQTMIKEATNVNSNASSN